MICTEQLPDLGGTVIEREEAHPGMTCPLSWEGGAREVEDLP